MLIQTRDNLSHQRLVSNRTSGYGMTVCGVRGANMDVVALPLWHVRIVFPPDAATVPITCLHCLAKDG